MNIAESNEADSGQRKLLANLSSDLQIAETRMFSQVEGTFKWLLATLWASNAGALAACVGSDKYGEKIGHYPLLLFGFGVVFSLLMGLLNLLFASRAMTPIAELRNIFVIGATVGDFDPVEVPPLTKRIVRTTIFKWPLWFTGIASLLSFIAGLSLAGWAVW